MFACIRPPAHLSYEHMFPRSTHITAHAARAQRALAWPARSCCSRTTTRSTGRSTRTSSAREIAWAARRTGVWTLGTGATTPEPIRTGDRCAYALRGNVPAASGPPAGLRKPISAASCAEPVRRDGRTHGDRAPLRRDSSRHCRKPCSAKPELQWLILVDEDGPPTTTGRPKAARVSKNRRRPTLPGPCEPSTIGAEGLNCSVRNGKRCFPLAKATGKRRETTPSRSFKTAQRHSGYHTHGTYQKNPSSPRPISTGLLQTLPSFQIRPINLVVYQGSYSL